MSSDKTFQTKGKCVPLGDLDHKAEEECAGGPSFSRGVFQHSVAMGGYWKE